MHAEVSLPDHTGQHDSAPSAHILDSDIVPRGTPEVQEPVRITETACYRRSEGPDLVPRAGTQNIELDVWLSSFRVVQSVCFLL